MDPLSAIGLVSAIVQFVDFGFKLSKRLSEYGSADPEDTPRALQTITTQIPLLLNALERVKSNLQDEKLDFDTRCVLRGVVAGCMNQARQVEEVLDRVSNRAGDSVVIKTKKAFRSLHAEEKLVSIEKNLHTYMSVLILHHVVDEKTVLPRENIENHIFEVPLDQCQLYEPRQDLLNQIDRCFWKVKTCQTEIPISVYLIGGVGVGKAQLARAYCKNFYESGVIKHVFWMDASSPQTLRVGLQNIANVVRKVKIGSPLEKTEFSRRYLADRWHPWLLVLHNYDETAFEEESAHSLLPKHGMGAFIFTVKAGQPPGVMNVIEVPQYNDKGRQETLNATLTNAIENGDSDAALQALASGADKNSLHEAGYSAMARACLKGLTEVVVLLLDRGVDPHTTTWTNGRYPHTPFLWSVRHPDILDMLLRHEDETNSSLGAPFYDAALKEAAERGYERSVNLLLNKRDVNLESAITGAAREGRTKVLELLLTKRAQGFVDRGKGEAFLQGTADNEDPLYTCLQKANYYQRYDTGKAIISVCSELGYPVPRTILDNTLSRLPWQFGMNRDASAQVDMLRYLLASGADPNSNNSSKMLALHHATSYRQVEMVRVLLENGAQPWLENIEHVVPLTIVAGWPRPDVEIVRMLLGAKYEDSQEEARQKYMFEALQLAIKSSCDLVLALLDAGTDPNGPTGSQDMPETRRLPLTLSIEDSDAALARLLLKRGARADVFDHKGRLPLSLAAEKNQPAIVREILRRCAKDVIDLKDKNGDTALIVAAKGNCLEVVKLLLENHADRNIENRFGDSPFELAEEKGYTDIMELLE